MYTFINQMYLFISKCIRLIEESHVHLGWLDGK